jgi:hypothetical protein
MRSDGRTLGLLVIRQSRSLVMILTQHVPQCPTVSRI